MCANGASRYECTREWTWVSYLGLMSYEGACYHEHKSMKAHEFSLLSIGVVLALQFHARVVMAVQPKCTALPSYFGLLSGYVGFFHGSSFASRFRNVPDVRNAKRSHLLRVTGQSQSQPSPKQKT